MEGNENRLVSAPHHDSFQTPTIEAPTCEPPTPGRPTSRGPTCEPPTSQHSTYETLTIRSGIPGILQEPEYIGCDKECRSALQRHLRHYLGSGEGSGAYWYWGQQRQEFFTLQHDRLGQSSTIGYHRAADLPARDGVGRRPRCWYVSERKVDWKNAPGNDLPATPSLPASRGVVKKQDKWVQDTIPDLIRQTVTDELLRAVSLIIG
jgi:hypothetical protein